MRVVQQQTPGQAANEHRVANFFAQFGDHRFEIQCGDRVRVMRCRAQGLQNQIQAVGHTVAADLALVQFQLVQHSFELCLGDALIRHVFNHAEHQGLQGLAPLGFAALNTAAEHQLAQGVLQAAQRRRRGAQLGGLQGLLQRRGAVLQQHAGQQLRFEPVAQPGALAQQPGHNDMRFAPGVALFVVGIGLGHGNRRRQASLQGYGNALVQAFEVAQRPIVEHGLMPRGRYIAKGHKSGVARVVMRLVERLELCVAQVGNRLGVAAGIVVIGAGGEQVMAQALP